MTEEVIGELGDAPMVSQEKKKVVRTETSDSPSKPKHKGKEKAATKEKVTTYKR